MEYPITKTVESFYNGLKKHTNHRYISWQHCFNAFQRQKKTIDIDYLSLHLGFYLASWGMYRGSSALLWKDYKIHNETVNIMQKYDVIHCSENIEIDESHIDKILEVKSKIIEHYQKMEYVKPTKDGEKSGFISASDTLVSKILLGSLGCVPAYDRFVLKGFGQIAQPQIEKTFNKQSLKSLFDFLSTNRDSFSSIQKMINRDSHVYYPLMKIVDMYFWEIGRLKFSKK